MTFKRKRGADSLTADMDKMSSYICKFLGIFVLGFLGEMGVCGCTICREKDFDKFIAEKTLITISPIGFYNFSDDEFRGEARIDGLGFQVRHNVGENIYLGGSFRGEGSPVDENTSSIFYDGVIEFNRLFFTVDYEFVVSENPLTRLGFGIYPGFVFPSISSLNEDFEDDLKLQGRGVSQSIENAFDLCIGAKLIWNPKSTILKDEKSIVAVGPGLSVNVGYDFTTKSTAKSRMYDSIGIIESASKKVDLGGFYLMFGVEF